MAKEQKERPSLAPPKLFGRREREDTAEAEQTAAETTSDDVVEAEPTDAEPTDADASVLAAAAAGIERDRPSVALDKPADDPPEDLADPDPDEEDSDQGDSDQGDSGDADGDAPHDSEHGTRPRRSLPPLPQLHLPGQVAAALTGVVVGLALVGLTWLAFQGCGAVQDTTSCGTGPGMVLMLVVFIVGIALGRALLAITGQPDPMSTSFLGTGLTAIIAMLFLIEVLDHWSMLLAIPAICAASFLLSWWMTTTFVNEADRVDSAPKE